MEHILDHDAQLKARLAEQYRNKAKIDGVLTAIGTQTQDVEDALWELFELRMLENATGIQLDRIGGIVGVRRQGLSDEDYLIRIEVQILLNRSSATVEDLLAIMNAFLDTRTYEMKEFPPQALEMHVDGGEITAAQATLLLTYLRRAKAATISTILWWNQDPDEETFCFDGGTGLGFGEGTWAFAKK